MASRSSRFVLSAAALAGIALVACSSSSGTTNTSSDDTQGDDSGIVISCVSDPRVMQYASGMSEASTSGNVKVALMMATPHGDAVRIYPKQAGRYHLVDHDRKYVIDDLMVFRHPLHAVTEVTGHYRVDGIPVGKMRVTVSHPQIQNAASTTDVDIQPGVVATVDLTLNYNPPSPSDAGAADAVAPYPGLH